MAKRVKNMTANMKATLITAAVLVVGVIWWMLLTLLDHLFGGYGVLAAGILSATGYIWSWAKSAVTNPPN
jgi:hypothetical protein